MNPSTDERIASIIRALSEVILPHLPPEASLAQEQTHLAIGQLQILKMQLDAIPAYEREELEDAKAIGAALANVLVGGNATDAALTELRTALTRADGADVRGQTNAINLAIDLLVRAVSSDGGDDAKAKLSEIILKYENVRAQKDRLWFMPFGFDNPETVGPVTLGDGK
jgi:thioredoxin-like negative regulator of GroEL